MESIIGQEVEPPSGSGGNPGRLQGEVKYHMELNTKDLYKAKIKQRVLLVAICYDYLWHKLRRLWFDRTIVILDRRSAVKGRSLCQTGVKHLALMSAVHTRVSHTVELIPAHGWVPKHLFLEPIVRWWQRLCPWGRFSSPLRMGLFLLASGSWAQSLPCLSVRAYEFLCCCCCSWASLFKAS